jgi:UDPglucose 6-dehydrogenase
VKVCVVGLWHLGTVTSACLAAAGHQVVGLDFDPSTVAGLQSGHSPVFEPGLNDVLRRELASGRLSFTSEAAVALHGAEIAWIAYDTPVDAEDTADVEHVVGCVMRLFPCLDPGTLVLVSSQVPVGTTRCLERAFAAAFPERAAGFGYSPENLRLGKAIDAFTKPDRVVVGLRRAEDRPRVEELLCPFAAKKIEWMSVESAEMTKHALNAFLATSVAFMNEVAALCERVGADAGDVERGLRTESRIGPRAYLSPGVPFSGGTLARDIAFLGALGSSINQPAVVISAVQASNNLHKQWFRRRLQEILGELAGRRIAIWGLTYKPGTDTLRRSLAVELCVWLAQQGSLVQIHDPAVKRLPDELTGSCSLFPAALQAVEGAEALVVATEWPEYRAIPAEAVAAAMRGRVVLDAGRFLLGTLGNDLRFRYAAVGRAL